VRLFLKLFCLTQVPAVGTGHAGGRSLSGRILELLFSELTEVRAHFLLSEKHLSSVSNIFLVCRYEEFLLLCDLAPEDERHIHAL
jgi:hypothetical protein